MANKETDIVIENQNMQIELTDYMTFWSSIVGLPSSNTALVEYLNTLLATKQADLTTISGYNASVAQTLQHDASGNLMWVNN